MPAAALDAGRCSPHAHVGVEPGLNVLHAPHPYPVTVTTIGETGRRHGEQCFHPPAERQREAMETKADGKRTLRYATADSLRSLLRTLWFVPT